MANNMNEGLEAEGSRADHALRIKTPAGTEISTNDKWTARIIVTTAGVAGIVAVGGVTKFCLDQPQVVEKAVEVALKIWGEVSSIKFGSVIIELDCGSEEKLLQFLDDFENGNVKAALEKEFRERGYNSEQDLLVTLDKKALPKAILIRRTMHSITEEKVMVQNLNPFVTAVEKDRKYKPDSTEDPHQSASNVDSSYKSGKRQKVTDVEKGRENEDGPKTKGRQEANPKQGPSTSAEREESINLRAPHSPEVKQDDKGSGSAKKRKRKTPLVSRSSRTKRVKKVNFEDSVPSDDVLEELAHKIGNKWKPLGRRLGFEDDAELAQIDQAPGLELSQKALRMLKEWRQQEGPKATNKILYEALRHKFVGRTDLAEYYCTKK